MKNIKKNNNKGFSLVELIVVIAIMAVLVGVIAPTIMGNIERSRESRDIQTLDSIASACQVALTEEAASTVAFAGTYAGGVAAATLFAESATDDFAQAVRAALGATDAGGTANVIDAVNVPDMEAAQTSAAGATIMIYVATNGQITVQVENATGTVVGLPRNNTTATVTR